MHITDLDDICVLISINICVIDSVKAFTSGRSEALQIKAVLMGLSDIDWWDLQLSEQKKAELIVLLSGFSLLKQ